MDKIKTDRELYIGEHNVVLESWNPAFSLATLRFGDGTVIENLFVSEEVHSYLWKILREEDGRLYDERLGTGLKNLWKVDIIIMAHSQDTGPNHCGLSIESTRWIGKPPIYAEIKTGFRTKRQEAWENLKRRLGLSEEVSEEN